MLLFYNIILFLSIFYLTAKAQEGKSAFDFLNLPISSHINALGGNNISIIEEDVYGLVAEPGMNLLEDAYGKNGHIKSGKVMCDYFLEDGDYFRLDNITLGWTPKLDTKWISNLRVYATVKNAFTITKYSVMDPTSVDINGLEPGISGLNVYPIARSFTFGIQISY